MSPEGAEAREDSTASLDSICGAAWKYAGAGRCPKGDRCLDEARPGVLSGDTGCSSTCTSCQHESWGYHRREQELHFVHAGPAQLMGRNGSSCQQCIMKGSICRMKRSNRRQLTAF